MNQILLSEFRLSGDVTVRPRGSFQKHGRNVFMFKLTSDVVRYIVVTYCVGLLTFSYIYIYIYIYIYCSGLVMSDWLGYPCTASDKWRRKFRYPKTLPAAKYECGVVMLWC